MLGIDKVVARFALPSALAASLICGVVLSGSLGASCASFGPCDSCDAGKENYACDINGTLYYDCKGSQYLADIWCSGIDPAGKASPSNCYAGLETGETTWGSDSWDPASNVSYNVVTGECEIDEGFVTSLMEDGFAPLSLDSARLVLSTVSGYSGYYELDNVGSGDLADVIGLQDADIIISVNGYDLNTTDEQLDAYQALKSETELTLLVRRSGSLVTIVYVIVP